ncbi:shikimate dehydrogenase [Catenovulum adriaticum]|uniref:Shikimate dehydrogenase (NADP(+)) n=1 Tax=Catenovulum adriaticum TaxID=2984846 RepID=A0ABY7ALX8_9ALTE|nr:shikimate dehydrogenase [Catenovulum sp. TS8]WAJ70305.1 shikimate dehydrogenase [Catenovulum sp. TS8]
MDQYKVYGNPIKQSKSPLIHTEFAKQTDQAIEYTSQLSELDTFEQDIAHFIKAGGKGCNVTMPFKERAFNLANKVSERAQLAQAANTLSFLEDGTIEADTTDGPGLVNDLLANGICLKGMSILLVGAGGAASGVIQPLLQSQPRMLVIANRTVSKATELAQRFGHFGNIEAKAFNELDESYDLVINSTSTSLTNELPAVPSKIFKQNAYAYDMVYGDKPTLFVEWAYQNGVKLALDGLGMLVGQAAESFYIWRNVKPDLLAVVEKLRGEL